MYSYHNSTYRLHVSYEVGQEEPDSLRVDKICAEIQISNKLENHFFKIDTNSERIHIYHTKKGFTVFEGHISKKLYRIKS
ncbi:UNVERIFIED_CONTAM: hypothetical protein NCL1_20303 [Trichonephila clavipes]